ncbi:PPOX class F420-dependent oxidoreductase [Oscillochloris sp. ZM17-4]|uniref:PPOX class F420-dependent oxidoreductase n=1 Tax=Oscillochloris sp. ZM17-4 TaxID=2866714 RepID=UPI001C72F2D8|nr:PPOX class F420-dependent oxidoreductase [Oscillochloris sp. ZM17-4]MBX0327188.1 PPOX class F420-dependent oxidoreductase [Oscillochloris sp. ZM17-4]
MSTTDTRFAALEGAEFMVLTTYRRSGDPMPTTVWFAEAGGRLYVTTQGQAGKAKRIRANPAVLVAPSDRVGNVSGPAASGQARILDQGEAECAEAALRAKYGEQYTALTGRMAEGAVRIFIEVTP